LVKPATRGMEKETGWAAIQSSLTPLLLPSVAVCPEKRAHPWKAPPPETEKSTTTLEAATAAVNLRSVGGGKLQTPAAWLMAASSAARLPALGFTMKYLVGFDPVSHELAEQSSLESLGLLCSAVCG